MAQVYGQFYMLSPWWWNASPSFTAGASLDGSADKQGWNFNADDALTITRLGIRLHTLTGTSPTYRISLQGQNTSGNPDGTIKGGGSPASATFNPSSLSWAAGDWRWVTLDNSYTCTAGEALSVVVEYSSGTINASNFIALTASVLTGVSGAYPTPRQDTAGSWAKVTSHGPICLGYGTSSRAYGWPLESITGAINWQSASTPDEYAMRFIIPTSMCSTYKIQGFRWHGNVDVGTVITATLYDGTTSQATGSVDGDSCGSSPSNDTAEIRFTSFPTLTAGNTYRIGLTNSSAATTTRIYQIDVDTNDDWDALPGGKEVYMSTRTDAGAWSDTTTARFLADLYLYDLTPPAGGGTVNFETTNTQVIYPRSRSVGYR